MTDKGNRRLERGGHTAIKLLEPVIRERPVFGSQKIMILSLMKYKLYFKSLKVN